MSKSEPKIGRYNWLAAKQKAKTQIKSVVKEAASESPSSPSEPEDYFDVYAKEKDPSKDWPVEYWKIIKLIGYVNKGEFTLVTVALVCLAECDFTAVTLQALKDESYIYRIMNLVSCGELRVQVAALRCLEKLARFRSIRYELVYFGGLQTIVELLYEPSFELRKVVAETIATISVFHRAWKIARLKQAIPLLANLLYAPRELLDKTPKHLTFEQKLIFDTAAAGAKALYVLCEDKKNIRELWKCEALTICASIILSSHKGLLTEVISLLQRCADMKYFRTAIRKLGILNSINNHLYEDDLALTEICAKAVFKCAEDSDSRELFSQKGFVEKIFEIIKNPKNHSDEGLMSSVSGALWKCAKSLDNVKRLQKLGSVPVLLNLLKSHFLRVQVHIVGCLGLCFRHRWCCEDMLKYNGMEILIDLLSTTSAPLIVNLNRAMAEASKDKETMKTIERLNAIEKVWSHLKNTDLRVISCTAWSLGTLLENISDCSSYVHSLIGGMEVVMNLLSYKETSVSTPGCNLIVVLSRHKENLSLLTEYGVVRVLSKMVNTKCKRLRYYLCMAIYACAPIKNNLREFARPPIVQAIIKILKSKIPQIQAAACFPLCRFSLIPMCCLLIYECKIAMTILVELMDSDDTKIQESAAATIQNIRIFSLLKEKNATAFLLNRIEKRRKELAGDAVMDQLYLED